LQAPARATFRLVVEHARHGEGGAAGRGSVRHGRLGREQRGGHVVAQRRGERDHVRGGGHALRVHGLELRHVVEDRLELARHRLGLGGLEPEPRQVRHSLDLGAGDARHGE
jgi:hypothetical protein